MVREIDACFTAVDAIMGRFQVEKVKTLGDGYLCVSGLVERDGSPAERILGAAFAMVAFIEARHTEMQRHGRSFWRLRVGIHTGPVVAGVVGRRKSAFDIWGDTVNMASRFESAGLAGRINVSEEFLALVRDKVAFTPRGLVPIKGAADRPMFFIDAQLPNAPSARGSRVGEACGRRADDGATVQG